MKISWYNIRFFLVWIILIPVLSYGQDNGIIQRLKSSLDTVRTDRSRVDVLNEIAKQYVGIDLFKSMQFAESAKALGDSINYRKGVANANKYIGMSYYSKGDYPDALNYLMSALDEYLREPDSLQIADIYNSFGNVYGATDNFEEAKRYYKIADAIYLDINNFRKHADISNNIATIFLDQGQPDSAIAYLDQSTKSYLEFNDEQSLSVSYINYGYAFALKGDYLFALKDYQKSYDLAKKYNLSELVAVSLLNLGDGYMNLGDLSKARKYVRMGLDISIKEGLKQNQYIGIYTLGEIAEKAGDYKASTDWYKKAQLINSELNSSDTKNALLSVQSRQLKESSKREIEKIKAINSERLKNEQLKNMLLMTAAAVVLLLLLGTTYFFNRRHKAAQKIAFQNNEINKQKSKIEEQSKRITSTNDVLQERNIKLRKLNDEKNCVMNIVAHDLKSPLNQINGLTSVINMETGNLTSTQKDCLRKISIASERLTGMIDKILDSKAIESGEENLHLQKIDMREIVDELIPYYSSIASKKEININTNIVSKCPHVSGDKQYIRQIMENLISNALKFSPSQKTVDINVFRDKDYVVTEVQDQGPGITEEDKKHLFKEYATLSARPTGDEISTGLGLSIVKKYVDKLGGEVWCESKPGQGASFKVKFQVA